MNRITRSTLLCSLALPLVLTAPARSEEAKDPQMQALEESINLIRGDVSARRESALSTLIRLEGEQASAFRTLKQQYDLDVKKLDQERGALVREYAQVYKTMNKEKAAELAARTLQVDEQRNTMRRKYYDLMAEQVSPIAAVQFLQLQRRFDSMLDMKASTAIPIAGY